MKETFIKFMETEIYKIDSLMFSFKFFIDNQKNRKFLYWFPYFSIPLIVPFNFIYKAFFGNKHSFRKFWNIT